MGHPIGPARNSMDNLVTFTVNHRDKGIRPGLKGRGVRPLEGGIDVIGGEVNRHPLGVNWINRAQADMRFTLALTFTTTARPATLAACTATFGQLDPNRGSSRVISLAGPAKAERGGIDARSQRCESGRGSAASNLTTLVFQAGHYPCRQRPGEATQPVGVLVFAGFDHNTPAQRLSLGPTR